MTIFSSDRGMARGNFHLRLSMIAATLCLAACQPAQPLAATPSTTASEVAVPPPALEAAPAAAPSIAPPMPIDVPDDEFVGWYFEKDGTGQLLACGQTAPLQVADPAFLRELKRKLGSGDRPVYVRLRVRLTTGSQLEVTEVRQFGVDETPVVDCVLASGVR